MKDQLREEIITILVQTTFHASDGYGNTAEEIRTFGQRADKKMRDDWRFNARVQEQVGFIMQVVNKYCYFREKGT